MNINKWILAISIAALGFGAGHEARAGQLDISQSPLFLLTPIKPAMVMAVDDSGSMDSEVMLPTNDGALWWEDNRATFTGWETDDSATNDVWAGSSTLNFNAGGDNDNRWHKYTYLFPNGGLRRLGDDHHAVPPLPQFAYVRSHVYNPIYFDPSQTYIPYPSQGSETFGDADPENAFWDVVHSNNDIDLTEPIREDSNGWVFRMQEGMVVPAGTIVDDPDQGDFCMDEDLDWEPVPSDFVLGSDQMDNGPGGDNDSCRIAVEYYAPTFWLPATMGAPAGFTGTAITGGEAPDGSEMYGYEIRLTNFPSNYGEMIQNFANWFQYYRKRVHLTRSAIGQSFAETSFLKVGSFMINSRNTVDMLDMGNDGDRVTFFDDQYELRANGGTPNKQAVDHIGRQFRRTGTGAPIVEACQKNFGVLFTDGFSNSWTGAGVGNTDGDTGSALSGTFLADNESNTMADIAYEYYANNLRPDLEAGRVPTAPRCDLPNPSLELDCQDNLHMNFYSVLLGGVGIEFRRNAAATADPYANPPSWPTSFPTRNPTAIDDIWHAALNTRGGLFAADRPQDLIAAFSDVLSSVASSIQPVGISTSSTRLDSESQIFIAEFDSTRWSGDLIAQQVDSGATDSASDSMGSNRDIFTWDPSSQSPERFGTGMAGSIIDRIFPPATTTLTAAQKNAVINYLAGSQADEEQNGGELRDRDGVIGDIVNSQPTFSGAGNEGWGRLPGSAGTNYASYVDFKLNTRSDTVLVGANAGMMHAFDPDTMDEQFAFIPSAVQPNLAELAKPSYSHRFYVDGQIAVRDVWNGSAWRTIAVGGLGAGGKGVYALDVTNPGSFSSSDVLWEITEDIDPDIGHIYGAPVITRLANGNWVAIFGNGYNSQGSDAILFVVDLFGARNNPTSAITKVVLDDGSNDTNGLSAAAASLNSRDRLSLDAIYAGDLEGTMWRIDFSESGVATNAFNNGLFQDPDGRPITTAPAVVPNPVSGTSVFFGTGKLLEFSDRAEQNFEIESFWSIRDTGSSVNANSLEELTITPSGVDRVIEGAGSSGNGWVVDLTTGSATGERVLAKPRVLGGLLLFTTFQTLADPCSTGGIRRLYLLDAFSGAGRRPNCSNCAVIDLDVGAPIVPAVIIRPPQPIETTGPGDPDDPDFDPDTDLPDPGSVAPVSVWCSDLITIVPGVGQIPFGKICDGRQVWQQIR